MYLRMSRLKINLVLQNRKKFFYEKNQSTKKGKCKYMEYLHEWGVYSCSSIGCRSWRDREVSPNFDTGCLPP